MKLLSIIVPVYKVEKYLEKCIDSILKQTFSDFELILVDDGSPDNCGKMCDTFADKDERIVVIHKENGGISSARNRGIDMARGKYIGFVDSDDYIHPNMYEMLIENIVKSDSDIAVCGKHDVYENQADIRPHKNMETYTEKVLTRDDIFKIILSKDDIILPFSWNKVYKKEIFNEIKYPEGKTYEDIYILLDIMSKCNKMHVTTAPLYYYLRRNNSITGSANITSEMNRLEACKKNKDFYMQKYPQYLDNAEAFLCKAKFSVLSNMLLSNEKEYIYECNEIIKYLKSKKKFILTNSEFTRKRKISAIALFIDYRLFKLCIKVTNRI